MVGSTTKRPECWPNCRSQKDLNGNGWSQATSCRLTMQMDYANHKYYGKDSCIRSILLSEVLCAAAQIMMAEMCMDEPHPCYVWPVSTKSESIYTTFIESWVCDEVTTIFPYHLCQYCWDNTIMHATYIRHWLSDPSSSNPQPNSDRSMPSRPDDHFRSRVCILSMAMPVHPHLLVCALYGSCLSPRIPSMQGRSVKVLVDGVQETLSAAVVP